MSYYALYDTEGDTFISRSPYGSGFNCYSSLDEAYRQGDELCVYHAKTDDPDAFTILNIKLRCELVPDINIDFSKCVWVKVHEVDAYDCMYMDYRYCAPVSILSINYNDNLPVVV